MVWVARSPGHAIDRRIQPLGIAPVGCLRACSAAEQDALLSELEAERLDLGGFSSAIFFETLLANTIEGYFADPAYGGNRDMVSWRMIGFPGAYAAYLGVYTQHGIRFDREPLSMAHSHAHP
jgi:gluconate 2-dehydrogenase gamma chain